MRSCVSLWMREEKSKEEGGHFIGPCLRVETTCLNFAWMALTGDTLSSAEPASTPS